MTFPELCTALREARLAQGLSIEDIADKLKSTTRLVRDLEDANMAGLPHAVYTRGFIRTYAASVKLDLAEYQDCIDATWSLDNPDDYDTKPLLPPSIHQKKKSKYKLLLGFLVLCSLGAGGYWMYMQPKNIAVPVSGAPSIEQNSTASTTPAVPNASQKPMQKSDVVPSQDAANGQNNGTLTVEERTARDLAKGRVTADTRDSAVGSIAAEAQSTSNQASATSSADQKSDASHAVDVDAAAQTTAAPAISAQETEAGKPAEKVSATTPSEHVMVVTANQDCWLRIVPDGGKSKEMVLKKGNSLTQVFKKNLEMRFGNPAGVSLVYNGKAMPAPGKAGKAVTVMYPLQD